MNEKNYNFVENSEYYNFCDTKFDFSGPTLYELLEKLKNRIKELEEIIFNNGEL